MKKNFKILSTALLATSVLATSATVMAAEPSYGSSAATVDTNYSLDEMLTYAIQDEYMAQAEYEAIMAEYGMQRPFSNIVKAEAKHIELLLPLFEAHNVEVPIDDAKDRVVIPSSISESYSTGVEAEIKNIAMYDSFLDEDLPADVEDAFERLSLASENHLKAFEKAEDRATSSKKSDTNRRNVNSQKNSESNYRNRK